MDTNKIQRIVIHEVIKIEIPIKRLGFFFVEPHERISLVELHFAMD